MKKTLQIKLVILLCLVFQGIQGMASAGFLAGGCTDPGACNYNPAATFNDGSCCYDHCVEIEISASDFPDEIRYRLYDGDGNTVTSLSSGTSPSSHVICLPDGCYRFLMEDAFGDGWNGANYHIRFVNGADIISGGFPNVPAYDAYERNEYFLIGSGTLGCNDPAACNFDPSATCDDGSCDYLSCAGCTNPLACNYDAGATMDDGSCCMENCVTLVMIDYVGDGWNDGAYEIRDSEGNIVHSSSMSIGEYYEEEKICLPDGCYTFEVDGSMYPEEIEWTLYGVTDGPIFGDGLSTTLVHFTIGTVNCFGCTNPSACTYNPFAFIDDGSCITGSCVAYDNPWTARSISPGTYPTCANFTGTLAGATASQVAQTSGATGEDVWFRFSAGTNGIRFVANSANSDLILLLLDASYNVIKEVNLRNGTGEEALNTDDLVSGSNYYLCVRNADSDAGNGAFSLCAMQLRPSTGPSSPYTFTVCGTMKVQHTSADFYNFFFQDAINHEILQYSIANTTTISLLNVPGLRYGRQYNLRVGCSYVLPNSLGVNETLVIQPNFTRAITISDSPVAEVTSSFSCTSYGPISPATYISFNPRSCNISGYQIELVNQDGIQPAINFYSYGESRYFRFSQIPGYIPGAKYDVRVRPFFPYDYSAPYGTAVCLHVAGTSSFFTINNPYNAQLQEAGSQGIDFSASVYPNPNTGSGISVFIDSDEEREFFITVHDVMGRMVHTEQKVVNGAMNFELTNKQYFPTGVYTVNFYSNGDTQTQRMIVRNQ